MSLMLDDLYTDIASAIREKDKTTPEIKADTFAERILALQTKNRCSAFPLIVHSVKGASIKAVQGSTTISGTTDTSGNLTLWLPTNGEWKLTATKGSYTSPTSTVTIDGTATLEEVEAISLMGGG